jgi:hypothetical protein
MLFCCKEHFFALKMSSKAGNSSLLSNRLPGHPRCLCGRFLWASQEDLQRQLRNKAASNAAERAAKRAAPGAGGEGEAHASLPQPYDGPFGEDDAFSTIMQWLASRIDTVKRSKVLDRR